MTYKGYQICASAKVWRTWAPNSKGALCDVILDGDIEDGVVYEVWKDGEMVEDCLDDVRDAKEWIDSEVEARR
jgi:hypothetical protein